MRMYHQINGNVYAAPSEIKSMEEYKEFVRKSYGNLRNVKFTSAKDRNDAAHKLAR